MSQDYSSPYGYHLRRLCQCGPAHVMRGENGVCVTIQRADAGDIRGEAVPDPDGILITHSESGASAKVETFVDYRDVRGISRFLK
jgi:hypothetical protein